MFKRLAILALLVTARGASADGWTTRDTLVESAYVLAHLADWGTTAGIVKSKPIPQAWPSSTGQLTYGYQLITESNPLLGKHPSMGSVNAYFGLTLVGHVVISRLLPRPYREVWQAGTIGMEVYCVGHNFGNKLTLTVPW